MVWQISTYCGPTHEVQNEKALSIKKLRLSATTTNDAHSARDCHCRRGAHPAHGGFLWVTHRVCCIMLSYGPLQNQGNSNTNVRLTLSGKSSRRSIVMPAAKTVSQDDKVLW